jgi:N-acetylglucosaminyltransferase
MLQPVSSATFGGSGDSWSSLLPLGIAGLVVWSFWLYRFIGSRFARPIVTDFRTTTSVVVPSYREDPSILGECLQSWLAQAPTEVIVVVDTADADCIAMLKAAADQDRRVRPIVFAHEGKRSALGVGIRAATSEIIVLADSDTRWLPGLLEGVQMPFLDPEIGGVGTQQNVYLRRTNLWRRVADWMLDLRYNDMVPAMGRKGCVPCLSGRTAAYRREVITPLLPYLEHELFLGRLCVAGDDGRLTWLVIAAGYKTVHQRSARALSMFPDTFRAFVKQRIRWSRNSVRTYLTALWKGWLWRTPLVTKVMVLQILLTPLTMGLALYYLISSRLDFTSRGFLLAALWLLGGRLVRSYSHLRRRPLDIFLLPIYELVVITVALPIKLYATLTMNRQGWLTRTTDSVGGEAQGAQTLVSHLSRPNPEPVA